MMRDYMRNQGLVDGITGCRNRQRDLEKEIERLRGALERIAEGYPHGSLARDMAANALKERVEERHSGEQSD